MPKIISDDAVFKLQKIYYLYAIDKNGDIAHIYQRANGKQYQTPLTPFFLNYLNGIALEKVLNHLKKDEKMDDGFIDIPNIFKMDEESDEESDEEIECNHDLKNAKKQHISNATENNSKEVKCDESCINQIILNI